MTKSERLVRLTPKQENFCQFYLETGNATEAYKQAYDSDNMKITTISRKAFDALGADKITARIAEIRQNTRTRLEIDMNYITKGIIKNIVMAESIKLPAVAIKGYEVLARLHGLLDEKAHTLVISKNHRNEVVKGFLARHNIKTPERLFNVTPASEAEGGDKNVTPPEASV